MPQIWSLPQLSQSVIRPCRALRGRPVHSMCRSGGLKVEKWDTAKQGPLTQQSMLNKLRDEGYNTITYTFPPGTVFGDHSHGVDKKDSILSGRFLFRMGGEEVVLEPGDQLKVPRGATHYAEVVGSEAVTFVDASRY